MKCELCGFESSYLDEVSYYDINGYGHSDANEIEKFAQDPDALTYELCNECSEIFNFDKANQFPQNKVSVIDKMDTYGKLKFSLSSNRALFEIVMLEDLKKDSALLEVSKKTINLVEDKIVENLSSTLNVLKITGRNGDLIFNVKDNSITAGLILQYDRKNMEYAKIYYEKSKAYVKAYEDKKLKE